MQTIKKIDSIINSEKYRKLLTVIVWLGLLITVIAQFVPFTPDMPASNLDPSWSFGMNQAVAQGLVFGRDIIFTFGPYASIYTKMVHPATDLMMVGGSLYLAMSFYLGCFIVMRGTHLRWIFLYCVAFAGLMQSRDVILFTIPLLAGLGTFKILDGDSEASAAKKSTKFVIALLFAPFGLLPLIKGSLLISCVALSILCALFFIYKSKKLLALICLIAPVISMLFFWMAAGQPVPGLPGYFISMAPIISGYTGAMALRGPPIEVIIYSIAALFLLLAIFTQKNSANSSKIFLFCVYFLFLFLSLKAGFIRHDAHAIMAAASILSAALLWPFIFKDISYAPVILLALFAWYRVDNNYIDTSPKSIAQVISAGYVSEFSGIARRIENRDWPESEFNSAVATLKQQASFPVFQGTTDIYSYEQAYLISSGNTWSPRPILQSYSTYSPVLAEINRQHLLGSHAPDNIIFSLQPIDSRLPATEDGVSWPVLIANYQLIQAKNDFLFLRKKEAAVAPEAMALSTEKHHLGERVTLPDSRQLLFTQIDVQPSFLGSIENILFKSDQLAMALELQNGAVKMYIIIPGMARSGFVISPLVQNTAEFGMLFGQSRMLEDQRVKAITIVPLSGNSALWNDEYTIKFSQYKFPELSVN